MFLEITPNQVREPQDLHEAQIVSASNEDYGAAAPAANTHEQAIPDPALALDTQADLLRGLFREFKSLTERACDTAMRQAQRTAQVEGSAGAELTRLQLKLKEKADALEASEKAMRQREAVAKETIDSLEGALRDKDAQLESCQMRSGTLLAEIDGLNIRLNEAATAMKQAETRFRDFAEQQEGEVAGLRDGLAAKDVMLQGKDLALKQLDEQSCVAISALQRLLQTANTNLEVKETELRDKSAALEAASARDQAVGRLLQQLAGESRKLMSELREKSELVAELESQAYLCFADDAVRNNGAAVYQRLL